MKEEVTWHESSNIFDGNDQIEESFSIKFFEEKIDNMMWSNIIARQPIIQRLSHSTLWKWKRDDISSSKWESWKFDIFWYVVTKYELTYYELNF